MFQRRLTQRTGRIASSTPGRNCTSCTCSCGRTFQRNDFQISRVQWYASRQSPQRTTGKARAGDLERPLQEVNNGLEEHRFARLSQIVQQQKFSRGSQHVLAFLRSFAELASVKSTSAGAGVDVPAFNGLRGSSDVTVADCRLCGQLLLASRERELQRLGRLLMYTLSHSGDGHATLIIMEQTLRAAKRRPHLLTSSELARVRRSLTDMAADKLPHAMAQPEQLFMTKVCEGRVADCLGNTDYALTMWNAAIPGAVAYAEARPGRDDQALTSNSSPWINIFNATFSRGKMGIAKTAVDVGCRLEDPVSHFHAALMAQKKDQKGRLVFSAEWLWNMTKAAGAGHVKAAHALGVFYATAEWKYFNDEPPDRLKPTPFDTYPVPGHLDGSLGQRLTTLFGLRSAPSVHAKAGFYTWAAFPSQPTERWKMATKWLEVAMGMMYAPSFLVAAKLYMQENLSPKKAVPEAALRMNQERFEYASKAELDAGRKIEGRELPSQKDAPIPNPAFGPDKARDLVREVFYAVQAHAYSHHRNGRLTASGSLKESNDVDEMHEDLLNSKASINISKWSRIADMANTYTNEANGRLYDDLTGADLEMEARHMCDEMAWDLYDEDGGLMYRHKLMEENRADRVDRNGLSCRI